MTDKPWPVPVSASSNRCKRTQLGRTAKGGSQQAPDWTLPRGLLVFGLRYFPAVWQRLPARFQMR